MISKSTVKYIKSLQLKKYRKKAQSFLVEGAKSVLELTQSSYEITHLLATEPFLNENEHLRQMFGEQLLLVTEKQLTTLSALKNNQAALAIARIKPTADLLIEPHELIIALDRIRDPGNLGTIIRIADWYGVKKIICSKDCADFYHPKVIQASMGSFIRVKAYYLHLAKLLLNITPVYGAMLSGQNVHAMKFEKSGILLIGNESQGLSEELIQVVDHRIKIPTYGNAESLNAAVATAVLCDNIRRSQAN